MKLQNKQTSKYKKHIYYSIFRNYPLYTTNCPRVYKKLRLALENDIKRLETSIKAEDSNFKLEKFKAKLEITKDVKIKYLPLTFGIDFDNLKARVLDCPIIFAIWEIIYLNKNTVPYFNRSTIPYSLTSKINNSFEDRFIVKSFNNGRNCDLQGYNKYDFLDCWEIEKDGKDVKISSDDIDLIAEWENEITDWIIKDKILKLKNYEKN